MSLPDKRLEVPVKMLAVDEVSDFSEERSSCKVEIIALENSRGQVLLC
jgi:hypothetical protein